MKNLIKPLIIFMLIVFATAAVAKDMTPSYYRYVDEKGTRVMNHFIPPEFAQKGYEVLNASGQVIKVVPPAPTKDQIARVSAEREILQKYEILKRRFSSVDEIESAKKRKLADIDTNISILNGNISGLNIRIEGLMKDAASFERSGRTVPQLILQKIDEAKAELAVATDLMEIRRSEYDEIIKSYDDDAVAFTKGQILEEKRLEQTVIN